MNKLLSVLLSIVIVVCRFDVYGIVWSSCDDDVRRQLPLPIQAYACGMTETEFEYLARVIEAESDRTDSIDGKILICAVILNRVASDDFPDSIQGVLDQRGQFDTTYNGWCNTSYTESSRWSIVICQRQMAEGNIPDNLLYFNSIGYFSWGTAYCECDGNYFSLG